MTGPGYSSTTFKPRTDDLRPNDPENNANTPPPQSGWEPVRPQRGLALTYFEDFAKCVEKKFIFKNLIALGETSAWIGPPGCGKSSVMTEIAMHCATKRNWRGQKIKFDGGVVIFALERADLYRRRLFAYQKRDDRTKLPIAVAGDLIDVLNLAAVDIVLATVRNAEAHFGCEVRLIIIDTFSKAIAAGKGDEDKAKDQNQAANFLQAIHNNVTVHIATVGHTGKDEGRGARGSNAYLGHVDLMVQLSGEGETKTANITKANDGLIGPLFSFTMEPIDIGKDDDGDPITVALVSGEQIATAMDKNNKQRNLPRQAKLALHFLNEAVAEGGRIVAQRGIPPNTLVVTIDEWRDTCHQRGLSGTDKKDSLRRAVQRAQEHLQGRYLIGVSIPYVWPARAEDPWPQP